MYKNLWDGVDLSYYFTADGLKYDYIVSPEADVSDIAIEVSGANIVSNELSLDIQTPLGSLMDTNLLTYGTASNKEYPSTFEMKDKNTYGFLVHNLTKNRTETITIDPLVYSTYIGGSDTSTYVTAVHAVEVDENGCAYITGRTNVRETDGFPIGGSIPGYDTTYCSRDAFIVKLNEQGTQILYSTYIGGSSIQWGSDLKLDGKCAIIVGCTSSSSYPTNFPIGGGIPGFDKSYGGSSDGFCLKLNEEGTNVLFSTWIGGSRDDNASSLSVDENGCVYISGRTRSSENEGFPINESTVGYDKTYNGGYDGYILKLSRNGDEVLYATYFGGSQLEEAYAIDADNEGNCVITGYTLSPHYYGFPVGNGVPGYDQLYNGDRDCYIA